jgi:putative membrane protein
MSAFVSFLHFLAAFTLVAALTVEFVLIRGELTLASARKLRAADIIYGSSAGVVLVAGLLRVFYFEKGSSYYFASVPFIAKITLFIVVALLSIYPTIEFSSWRKSLRIGQMPHLSERKRRAIRSIIHWQLAAIVLLVLCAALMAKGIGYRG